MDAHRARRAAPPPSRGITTRSGGGNRHARGEGAGDGGADGRDEDETAEAMEAELLAMVRASLEAKIVGLEEDRWMFEGGEGMGEVVDP